MWCCACLRGGEGSGELIVVLEVLRVVQGGFVF